MVVVEGGGAGRGRGAGQRRARPYRPPNRPTADRWEYKLEKELGHGNFSHVWRAVHRMSGKAYAIKKSKKPVTSLAEKNQWLAVGGG